MMTAMKKLLAARLRSDNFIRAGWIPARDQLARLTRERAGLPGTDSTVRQIGKPKGNAKAAVSSLTLKCAGRIENTALAKRDKKGALLRIGEPGLDRAFADEAKSILDYIAKKQKPADDKFNRQ
jgi:hypothetical protein